MYAELRLMLKPQTKHDDIVLALEAIIGVNKIAVADAVKGTPLEDLAHLAICAEKIPNRAVITYFKSGSDMLLANIFAQTLTQLRSQCDRISRQTANHGIKIVKVEASILVSENGLDVDIYFGEKISFPSKLWSSLKDHFLSKALPPFVTVMLAMQFLPETNALVSAKIALVVAGVTALADALLSVWGAKSWQWKEST